ncbi:uncharacterized protein Pyn_10950 [Prunus yedoensis var. nudiflora]|uniref:Uncharacterized protein n=1 Tax=Prunus yedoensis var. nudiflora TaxID=2094558 RepID=A0A314XRE8_PRUYE|nr:uncharacterized protein Pyn_10950 [Prunus yedoensis var. nudiflora]
MASSSPPGMVVHNRFLGFLIWQSIPSTVIFFIFKTLSSTISSTSHSTAKPPFPFAPSVFAFVTFLTFHLSQLLFSFSLSLISSPHPHRLASPLPLALGLIRFLFVPGGSDYRSLPSLGFGLSCRSGSCCFWQRWRFRMGLRVSHYSASSFFQLQDGTPFGYHTILEAILPGISIFNFSGVFLPHQLQNQATIGKVLHTKRFVFAPPKGSAAAETNPSEHLLAALEESSPNSLLQYLAYLDLYMVCENNVDTWRRAAFFEESGETYKRVISVCLRPLEQLASKLGEGLESSVEKSSQISNQLLSPTDQRLDPKYSEPLNNFQLYAWCAWTAASLTTCSHREDRFGVAQLSGSNAAVISTLISCLLAIETYMGKKTNLQSAQHFMGSTGFKLRTSSVGNIGMGKKRAGPLHSKAYAIADVLRNSIYHIVSTFHDQMASSAKKGILEKDWIISDKPPFGERELLLQKLHLFLDFRAS